MCEKRFNFTRITDSVILRGISFINCGGRGSIFENGVSNVRNFIIEDSLLQSEAPFYIQDTTNIQFINSTFTHSPRGVFDIFLGTSVVMIRNCTFSDNNIQASTAGVSIGVVLVSGRSSSVTIETTVFKNNHVSGERVPITAVFQGRGQQLTVVNSTFFRNGGGAIYSQYKSVTISRSEFSNNYAEDSAGAVTISGTNTVAVITNRTVFFNNTSSGGSTSAGAVDVSADRSSIIIKESIFNFNNGTFGGAFGYITSAQSDNSSILFSDCSFTQNTGDNLADGVAIEVLGFNVSLTVQRSRFSGNNVTGDGGAMSLRGDLRMVLINESTFESNSASDDGAISVFYLDQKNNSKFVITNSIFTGNSDRVGRGCGVLGITVSPSSPENFLYSRTVQVISSVFQFNTQTHSSLLSGVMCLSNTNAFLVNSNFTGNSQRALIAMNSTIAVDGCVFNNNFVERDGGAVFGSDNVIATFNQTVFTNNRAGCSGGAVYLSNSQATFYDSTFGFNRAITGGAIAIEDGSVLNVDDSNVFYNNTSRLGSVISACNSPKVNVNISGPLFASINETQGKKCVICPINNSAAISSLSISLMFFTVFITSSVNILL